MFSTAEGGKSYLEDGHKAGWETRWSPEPMAVCPSMAAVGITVIIMMGSPRRAHSAFFL
jgi:hypothetical protein